MDYLMDIIKPEYFIIITISMIIILSFIFNLISIKTNIPSVLLLMALGVLIQYAYPGIKNNTYLENTLIVIGKAGLIMIVLEAALDLRLKRDKAGLIIKAFLMAFLGLVVSAFLIALAIQYFLESSFYNSLVFAVPLSIMSSAIIIPSVSGLTEYKKEFMIYESTFSDILGIILFQFLIISEDFTSTTHIVFSVVSNIVITVIVAVVTGYLSVWAMQKLTGHVKFFLVIAVLMLLYAIGSVFHLSSLILILLFGLMLNNTDLFYRGILKNAINDEKIKPIFKEFYTITLESAFVLRTFFFVTFGITISLISLVNFEVAIQSLVFTGILYLVRLVFLKIIYRNRSIMPELFIAPRGLITVLLFFTIPANYFIKNFDQGVLLYVILATSFIMTIALVIRKGGKNISEILHDYDELHDTIEKSFEQGHLELDKDDMEKK